MDLTRGKKPIQIVKMLNGANKSKHVINCNLVVLWLLYFRIKNSPEEKRIFVKIFGQKNK